MHSKSRPTAGGAGRTAHGAGRRRRRPPSHGLPIWTDPPGARSASDPERKRPQRLFRRKRGKTHRGARGSSVRVCATRTANGPDGQERRRAGHVRGPPDQQNPDCARPRAACNAVSPAAGAPAPQEAKKDRQAAPTHAANQAAESKGGARHSRRPIPVQQLYHPRWARPSAAAGARPQRGPSSTGHMRRGDARHVGPGAAPALPPCWAGLLCPV